MEEVGVQAGWAQPDAARRAGNRNERQQRRGIQQVTVDRDGPEAEFLDPRGQTGIRREVLVRLQRDAELAPSAGGTGSHVTSALATLVGPVRSTRMPHTERPSMRATATLRSQSGTALSGSVIEAHLTHASVRCT